MSGNGGSQSGRSVASKVGSILVAFLPASRELSLNELALRAGLPLTTTYRLASELVEWGALERGEAGGYRVGLRLWEIGSLATRGATVREVAVPYMQDLYEATHENIQLAVLAGREALYIEKISGRKATPIRTRRGGRLPLHATGVGKVLLAYSPRDFLENVLDAGLKRYTPHTIVLPGLLTRTLTDIRRNGVGFAKEELTMGTVSVAAPVFNNRGDVVAAMSIVSRSSRADLRRLAPAVRTAAIGASRELRNRPAEDDAAPVNPRRAAAP